MFQKMFILLSLLCNITYTWKPIIQMTFSRKNNHFENDA